MTMVAIFILLLGCEHKDGLVTEEKTAPRSEKMNRYKYANSTDIYSSSGHYSIDGTNEKPLWIVEPDEYCIMEVNDSWLYYYEYEDETGDLKRIPLHKGDDGRDIIDDSRKERIRDTRYEQGFTIVGDYYAGISYGTVGILYNMNTKETVRKKVPEVIQYPKDAEMEDKNWYVLEKSDDWILWGGNGIFLQKIPSGEITVIKSKDIDLITASSENHLIFSEDKHSCFLYDINKMKKEKLVSKNEIQDAICKGLKRSEKELRAFHIDSIFVQDDRYYLQLKVQVALDEGYLNQYVILSQRMDQRNELTYDQILNAVLEKNELKNKKKNGKSTIQNNMKYICNIDCYWFLEAGKKCYCFNEKSQSVKEITETDPERNILYAGG